MKRLKALLRERRIGRLEVKKRGVDIEPAELRRKLKCPGDVRATLIVTPHGGNVLAILRVGWTGLTAGLDATQFTRRPKFQEDIKPLRVFATGFSR